MPYNPECSECENPIMGGTHIYNPETEENFHPHCGQEPAGEME